MGRIVGIVMYCSKSNNRYKEYFEEKEPGKWYGVRSEKLPPLSFFERRALAKKHTKKEKVSLLSKVNFKTSFDSNSLSEGSSNIQGAFFIGKHQCPFCGNTSFVKCGTCKEFSCHKEGEPHFDCVICGHSGEIKGKISSASGDLSSGNSKTNGGLSHKTNSSIQNKKW